MKINRKIIISLIMMSMLFMSLMVYLTYIALFQAEDLANNPYNRRVWSQEEDVLRGDIVDRNGIILAQSEFTDDGQARSYPYGELYCHVIGYNSGVYGRAQLEARYNDSLMGRSRLSDLMGLPSIQNKGYTLNLTIDHKVQSAASKALNGRKGAVVAMNPQTGEILAMYSNPGFDPNEASLVAEWNNLVNNEDAPFVSRVTNGLYAPGSTFKIITTAAALDDNLEKMTYQDEGYIEIGGMKITNYHSNVYGKLTFKKAFAVSANTYFAKLGSTLGDDKLRDMAEEFGFNNDLKFDVETTQSVFPSGKMTEGDTAQLAIGQHQILATPLQMLLTVSTVANDGKMCQPYLVTTNKTQPSSRKIIPSDTAWKIEEMMKAAVKEGTAKSAAISGVTVAGKTGTAENESDGSDHAWFVGYTTGVDKPIAVAVILEYDGGSGGTVAAPVAREVMKAWIDNNK